jgi:ribosome-associated protein
VANALEEKKGEDILILDITGISSFTDYFVICSGTTDRMLKSLADTVLNRILKVNGAKPRIEGKAEGGWLLLDLGDVIVHLFSPDQRDFYRLEELWSQGKVLLKLK